MFDSYFTSFTLLFLQFFYHLSFAFRTKEDHINTNLQKINVGLTDSSRVSLTNLT